eukprot:2324442-Rhodomonas_salina.2
MKTARGARALDCLGLGPNLIGGRCESPRGEVGQSDDEIDRNHLERRMRKSNVRKDPDGCGEAFVMPCRRSCDGDSESSERRLDDVFARVL